MANSQPTEWLNNKSKIAISPLLLIKFAGIPFYVGSKAITISSLAYQDLMKKKSSMSMTEKLPEAVNSIAATSGLTLNLVDWRGTIRDIFAGEDLLNEKGEFYLKLGSSTDLADALHFYSGTIADYSQKKGVLTLKMKNIIPDLKEIPSDEIKAPTTFFTSANKWQSLEGVTAPLQYGQFCPNSDPRFFNAPTAHYAPCPLAHWGEDVAVYKIASHQMDTMPSNFSLSDEAEAFVVRDKKYLHARFQSATFTNNSSGASVEVATTTKEAYLFLPPTALEAGNNVTGAENVYDGKGTTSVTMNSTSDVIEVGTFGFDEIRENTLHNPSSPDTEVQIRWGTILGVNSFRVTISDGTNSTQSLVSSVDSNKWKSYSMPVAIDNITDLENLTIKIEQLLGEVSAQVVEITTKVRVQDISADDPFIYIRCTGREFSGTWGSRKTTGALISYAPEIIESLLRDEFGYTDSDIDDASFDRVTDYMKLTGFILSSGSFFEKKPGLEIIRDLCRMFNLCLIFTKDKKWRLTMPLSSVEPFTQSGTGTPNNSDIFTDSETITSGEFDQNVIIKRSFETSRSNPRDIYPRLRIKYVRTHQGYLRESNVGTGAEKILENGFIQDESSADNLKDDIKFIFSTQKNVVRFASGYNAAHLNAGDIVNIRHGDLSGAMLQTGNENTQKWAIISLNTKWRPAIVVVKAIELV